jgi:(2Fe-2S) ferredoxin
VIAGEDEKILILSKRERFCMSYYKKHLFFCTNMRDDGTPCCGQMDAQGARKYLKERAKRDGIHDAGKVRINSAGCFGRCEQGPVIVIYPQGVWYTYVDREDLDQIYEEHLLGDKIVERLLLTGQ